MGARGVHAVRAYRGGPSGITEATALTLVGPDITSSFGAAVGAGDVDGDGYADVIVGAPDANAGAGAVHVYLGGPTMLARKPSTTIAGPDVAFGGFGSVVAMAGDVNGDGFADVLVGAPESISKSGRASSADRSGPRCCRTRASMARLQATLSGRASRASAISTVTDSPTSRSDRRA